jgi:hypothetical protein
MKNFVFLFFVGRGPERGNLFTFLGLKSTQKSSDENM